MVVNVDQSGIERAEQDALESAGMLLRARLTEIFELRDAVIKADDIEAVHDMRVMTRRIRSALRDLRKLIDAQVLNNLSVNLRSLASVLGEARDDDVAIVALLEFHAKSDDAEIRSGIDVLIAERSARRTSVQPRLVEALTEVELAKLLESFNAAFFDPSNRRPNSQIAFAEAGRRAIEKGIEEFIDLADSLAKPTETERLHMLRIAAKRLRYSMEFFGICWGNRLRSFAKKVAEMQTFLGEVHDADVWIENLDSRDHDKTSRWLKTEFFRIRTRNHREAFELWSDWREAGLIKKIRRTIQD